MDPCRRLLITVAIQRKREEDKMLNKGWRIALILTLIVPGMVSVSTASTVVDDTDQMILGPTQDKFTIPGGILAVLPPSVNTSASPSAISLNGVTYVFYKGSGSDPGIYVTSSDPSVNSGSWTNALRLPVEINTSAAPSVVVKGTTIYVVYKGSGNDERIFVARSVDATASWSMTRFPEHVKTSTGPRAYISGGSLHVFYKGSGSDARIHVSPLPTRGTWTLLSVSPHY
jgi:hypothetical protein